MREAGKCKSDQQELGLRGRPREGNPLRLSALGADQRQNSLRNGNDKGENQGEVSEFGSHGFFCAWSMACLASGGM